MIKFFKKIRCAHIYQYHETESSEPNLKVSCAKCLLCGTIIGPYALVKPRVKV